MGEVNTLLNSKLFAFVYSLIKSCNKTYKLLHHSKKHRYFQVSTWSSPTLVVYILFKVCSKTHINCYITQSSTITSKYILQRSENPRIIIFIFLNEVAMKLSFTFICPSLWDIISLNTRESSNWLSDTFRNRLSPS